MTDVACFCGCLFCFDGGAGTCPSCGEVANVTAPTAGQAADGSGRSAPVPQVLVGAGHAGRARLARVGAAHARRARLARVGTTPRVARDDRPRSLSGTGI
jgi:hypothetical protein